MASEKIRTIVIIIFLVLFGWTLYQNKALGITEYEIDCSANSGLSGFTIVHISDLHNERFGEEQQKLLGMVSESHPDMIAITGDFIDCRHPEVEISMEFIEGALKIAPVYYVPGNHERWALTKYQELYRRMEEAGVHLMVNQQQKIVYHDAELSCMGIEDPDFYDVKESFGKTEMTKKAIGQFEYKDADFTLLLSHRPELFEVYAEAKLDLVLTGHAHGGQFRLPLIGGLAAPNQGLFPKYDAGIFKDGDTNMIVSRGIGNSIIPLRFHNPPEIVLVTLTAE
jgi:predicted MPP superfamily phosphohydrolase